MLKNFPGIFMMVSIITFIIFSFVSAKENPENMLFMTNGSMILSPA